MVVSTDCGLYQLPRDVAFRKLRALVEGTHLVRAELGRLTQFVLRGQCLASIICVASPA